MRFALWLSIVGVSSLLAAGCGDDASVANDGLPVGDMGGGGELAGNGGSGAALPGNGGAGGAPAGGTAGAGATDGTGSTGGTAGETVEPEGDGGSSEAVSIAGTGTAAGCNSYTAQTDTSCGSYYCGVDLATLTAAIPQGAKCGTNPAYVCKGTLPLVVGACARKIKSANPLKSSSELRPQVRDCAYEDAEVKAVVTDECLGCYLDSAVCAGDNCLIECLAGDSPDCDACRLKNNCTAPVFVCNGLPSPL